ncbi:MAG: hypothetical protein FJ395_15695 [Verrucomicrobia bacterium]|nr:hypothetical protein [Verrucomicrobiota bacterium]
MRFNQTGGAAVLAFCVALASCGPRGPMPVTVEPFYQSKGCKVAVGKFSDGLAAREKAALLNTVAAMKEEWPELTPEAMYVAAIRLYDFGLKDESVYWFYSAQYRAGLVRGLFDSQKLNVVGNPATALARAHEAFVKQTGKYINGYAFDNIEKLLATVAQVQAEGARLPLLKQLYPNIAFIEESRWQKINYELSAEFSDFITSIRATAGKIRSERKARGLDGKY